MTGEARSVVVRLSADASQFISNMQAAGKAGQDTMAKLEGFTSRQGQALDQLGTSAGKFGLAAAAGLGMAGKAATDWESQFAGVEKTVDGTRSQITGLEDDLREMARSMPATHQEIAATAEAAGQLGVATEDVADFTETMLQLGETTDLTADGAATSIAQFMNVMGTAADEVDEIGNTLVDLGNKGASTESQILALAQRLSGIGQMTGASEQDVLGLASALANLGIEAELGGGAVQRVFLEINEAVGQGGDGLAQFARVSGMSASEFAQAWGNDPVRAFDALLQGLGGVQASGGNVAAVLDDLGIKGTQNLSVMLRLAGAGDTLTTALDQSGEAWESNSALSEEFAKRLGTTASEVQIAWNNIRDAGIDAGAAMLPVISAASEKVSDLAGAFQALPDPVQGALARLTGVAAVVGGAGWFAAKSINGVRSTRDALADIGLISRGTATDLDGVSTSAQRADTRLGRIAGRAAGIAAVGMAVGAIADEIGRIDPQNLERSMDALGRGEVAGEMDQVIDNLKEMTSWTNEIDSGEFVTLWGLFGDSTLDKMGDNVNEVDQRLASLVETGERAQALELFNDIVARSGINAEEAAHYFDAYKLALDNLDGGLTEAGDASALLGGVLFGTEDGALGAAAATDTLAASSEESASANRAEADALRDAVDAMQEKRSAALAGFDAETAYGQAIAAAREAAAEGARGIDTMTEAGRENRAALSQLAGAWNELPERVQDVEGRFASARRQFIDTAMDMGVSEERAKGLARQLLEIPASMEQANLALAAGTGEILRYGSAA